MIVRTVLRDELVDLLYSNSTKGLRVTPKDKGTPACIDVTWSFEKDLNLDPLQLCWVNVCTSSLLSMRPLLTCHSVERTFCLTNVILLQSDFDSFIDSDIITAHTPELLQLPIFDLLVFTVHSTNSMLKRSSTIHVDHLRDADDLWWRGFDGTSGQAWLQARPTTTFGMALAYCPIPLEVSTGTDDTYITRILASIVTEAYNVLGYNTSWHCKPRERKKVFTVPLPSAIRQQCGARVQGAWPVPWKITSWSQGPSFQIETRWGLFQKLGSFLHFTLGCLNCPEKSLLVPEKVEKGDDFQACVCFETIPRSKSIFLSQQGIGYCQVMDKSPKYPRLPRWTSSRLNFPSVLKSRGVTNEMGGLRPLNISKGPIFLE